MKYLPALLVSTTLATLASAAFAAPSPRVEGPALELTVRQLDFGKLAAGRTATRRVEIRNGGDSTLRLKRLGVNCDCARLKLATPRRLNVPIDRKDEGRVKLALEPGDSATLTITVDSSGLGAGQVQKQCLIYSNDKANSPATLQLSMNILEAPKVPNRTPEQVVGTPVIPSGPPKLVPDRELHDFGQVLRGESPSTTFTVKNTSDDPVAIERVRSTCSCTATKMWIGDAVIDAEKLGSEEQLGSLQPGEEARIEVELATGSIAGRGDQPSNLRKAVRVFHDDPGNPPLSLSIQAEVSSPVSFDPEHINFGRVRKSAGGSQSFALKGLRIEDYRLTEVIPPHGDLLKTRFEETQGGSQPSYRIHVDVPPGAPIGPISGSVVLKLDHPRVSELSIPMLAHVGPDVIFTGNDKSGSERLDFGILKGGEESTLELTILNHDPSVPYELKDVELTARPVVEPFSYEVIEDEKGIQYRVRLTVSKELTASFFSGRLRLKSDHPDVPDQIVDFRGWRKDEAP